MLSSFICDVGDTMDPEELVDVGDHLLRFRIRPGKGRPAPERISSMCQGVDAHKDKLHRWSRLVFPGFRRRRSV